MGEFELLDELHRPVRLGAQFHALAMRGGGAAEGHSFPRADRPRAPGDQCRPKDRNLPGRAAQAASLRSMGFGLCRFLSALIQATWLLRPRKYPPERASFVVADWGQGEPLDESSITLVASPRTKKSNEVASLLLFP